jgi:thymidylate kinase
VKQKKIVTFEGYDGAGKSTLIDAVRDLLRPSTVRVVGRKHEPELRGISAVVEGADPRPHPEVEMLLRLGLELERQHVIDDALNSHDLVCCDRGLISLVSWFDYLEVAPQPFEGLVRQLEERYRASLIIVCTADFEQCWARVAGRPDPSPKERLGIEANRRFFSLYDANVAKYAQLGFDIVRVDTANSTTPDSARAIMNTLISRELSPSPNHL